MSFLLDLTEELFTAVRASLGHFPPPET